MPLRLPKMFAMLLLACLLLLTGGSCVGYANAGTLKSTVDPGDATAVTATFQLNHGRLALSGGASGLMLGEFTTADKHDPVVNYAVHDRQGNLSVTQTGHRSTFGMIPIDTNWTVNLNDEMPLDLSVENGGARVELNLDTLSVNRLALNSGDGAATVSLDGVQRSLTTVGLSSTNGDLDLSMSGRYERPRVVDVTSTGGSVNLDLGSTSSVGLTGSVRTTSGAITITVPRDAGVKIETSTTTGTIDAGELIEATHGTFVSAAYRTSETTVLLEVRSVRGSITLRLAG